MHHFMLPFQGSDASGILMMLVYCVMGIVALAFYFLPTIIAFRREHQNKGAIFVLNLLLGWSLLGWVGSLVWSLTAVSRQ